MRTNDRIFLSALALGALAATWLASVANAQGPLRWRFHPGEQMSVLLTQTAATESKIGDALFRSQMRVSVELTWRVAAVEPSGAAVIEQTLNRLTVAADVPGSPQVRYDSRTPPDSQASPAAKAVAEEFQPLIGKTTRIRLTPQGEILRPGPGVLPGDRAARPGQGGGALTPTEVQQMLGRLLPRLPPQRPTRDTAWQVTMELPLPEGRAVVTGQFTYRGSEMFDGRTLAQIEAAYGFHGQGQEPGVIYECAEPDNTGAFYFDAATGRHVRGEVRQAMTMRLTVDDREVAQNSTSVTTIDVRPAD